MGEDRRNHMTERTADIAIVGGGIGGLALALHLHHRGVVCEVFEAVQQVQELSLIHI
jgi:2-polyprenyl-6-methoxyphenol hydroxylase-like FAD-dependent oxidoreductase